MLEFAHEFFSEFFIQQFDTYELRAKVLERRVFGHKSSYKMAFTYLFFTLNYHVLNFIIFSFHSLEISMNELHLNIFLKIAFDCRRLSD